MDDYLLKSYCDDCCNFSCPFNETNKVLYYLKKLFSL